MVLDGLMNGAAFRAYVEQVLAPTRGPGAVVVMDNRPVHAATGIREAIGCCGARLLFLQPYSPDFNAIEQAFAKLRPVLRKAAARTIPVFWDAIANTLDAFTPTECASFFANSG